MLKGLYIAHTGLLNEQNRMDILTNNLANASTVGFKKEGSTSQSFDDILTVKIKDASVGEMNVQKTGMNNPGVKIGENYVDYSQGSFRITDNTYDLALGGSGFFAVEFTSKSGETSTMYTRAGQFALNKEGYLVTQDGDYVLDENNNHIKLDPLKNSSIRDNGEILQDDKVIAKIQVTDFEDYDYLQRQGEVLYKPLEGAKKIKSDAIVNSGYLEMSNVQTVTEMVNLISITRAYESNQKIMQTYDESLGIAVSQLGKI